jgi:hypothetical protein
LRQVTEPKARTLIHWKRCNICAVNADFAAISADQAHYHIKAGRLARTIGAEQANDFTALKVERYIMDNLTLTKCLGESGCDKACAGLIHLFIAPSDGDVWLSL